MKKLIFILILSLVYAKINSSLEITFFKKYISETKSTAKTYDIETATMYNAETSQCDLDPLITAGMYKINPKKASEHKWIALSRNLLKRFGGDFNYGDRVRIEGCGHKDGIYTVADCMSKRFKKTRIDFLETKGTKPYKFTNIKLTKIEN